MIAFKVCVVSGGIERQTFLVEAPTLEAAPVELGDATLVDLKPGWAFVHYGPLSSASLSWTTPDFATFRAQRNADMGDAVRESLNIN